MVGRDEEDGKSNGTDSIVLLNTLTLDKISELQVSTFGSSYPKYTCWGEGANLIAGIEVQKNSEVYYQFRVCE